MSQTLLRTKLFIPQSRQELVPRPHLVGRLNQGLSRKLTLISAPAGYGKTTLISEWIRSSDPQPHVAWLSLDEADDDPTRFLAHFIAALQTVEAKVGEASLGALQSPQPPDIESVVTVLINEIAEVQDPFSLILDDYHLITAQPLHMAIAFLLDHLPPQMHLIIISRDDPFLPLSRLRARGQMIDIRADDLRFSSEETLAFLNKVMGLELNVDDIAALESRTEGWIAGLQLAALSIQGQDAAHSTEFISAFSGDDRYIVDYLVDEVLARRPTGTRDFLLQTSILKRMTGPLCDAVTEKQEGQDMLQRLERANLFIVALDNQRHWYRYHHLFTDMLRQRLSESASAQEIKSLHQRASRWYEENDSPIEAVEHSLATEDYDEVIRLIMQASIEMFQRSQLNTLTKWWTQLPQERITAQPQLCMMYAWAWVATGHPEEAELCLQAIEQVLDSEMQELFAGEEALATMPPSTLGALIEVAVVRAQLAIGGGNLPDALKLTHFALHQLEDDEGPYLHNPPIASRSVVLFIMGVAHKYMAELDAADKALTGAATLAQELNNVHLVALAYGHLAGVQASQGHLRQALQTCQQRLELVQQMAAQSSPMSGLALTELGNLLYEQNDLDAALHHLQEGIAVAKSWNYWDALVPGYSGLARVRSAQGDLPLAFNALDELAALGQNNAEVVMPVVESMRAMLQAAHGDVDAASHWARASGLGVDIELNPFREEETVILVRVLIAQKKWDDAAQLIERLMHAAENGKRWARVIELLVLRALLLDAQGEQDEALESLARAVTLAAPEGYVRVFVDAGPSMADLLSEINEDTQHDAYVKSLLAAFGDMPKQEESADQSALLEPLSKRELEVLRLLKTELSGPEIARELTLALSTVRTHTKSIYSKLNVNSRRAALSKAEELNLM